MQEEVVSGLSAQSSVEPEQADGRKERHDAFTAERRKAFVEALKKGGCVLDACRAVGVSNRTAYNWYEADRDFARQWDVALRMAAEDIEVTAYERGVIGVEEPVWAYGKLVGTRIRRSDAILRLLLIGSNRKKYGTVARPPRKRILAWEKKRIAAEINARSAAMEPSIEEVRANIMRKLDRIEEHEARQAKSLSGYAAPNQPGCALEDLLAPDESRELHGPRDGGLPEIEWDEGGSGL